ncbi:hypothetical protein OG223_01635 [Streptomyces sp. NBC_01478]
MCVKKSCALDVQKSTASSSAHRAPKKTGTDHAGRKEQGSLIRRCIIWRNKHAIDERLRKVLIRVNAA